MRSESANKLLPAGWVPCAWHANRSQGRALQPTKSHTDFSLSLLELLREAANLPDTCEVRKTLGAEPL
jgi:hypothetical protein